MDPNLIGQLPTERNLYCGRALCYLGPGHWHDQDGQVWYSNPVDVRLLDLATQLRNVSETLTRTQTECTRLLLENRELRSQTVELKARVDEVERRNLDLYVELNDLKDEGGDEENDLTQN